MHGNFTIGLRRLLGFIALATCLVNFTLSAHADEQTVMVGGAAMYPSKNIVENAMNSQDHTTLVTAVKAAGLVETLEGPGPFTVFAPTNEAFAKLPPGAVAGLLQPANKDKLVSVLTYHVVAGSWTSTDLALQIKKSDDGIAKLKTVQGGWLSVTTDKDGKWWVIDENGNKAMITIADVTQSNGVIHVIDTVLMPK